MTNHVTVILLQACIPLDMSSSVSVKNHNELLRCFAVLSKLSTCYVCMYGSHTHTHTHSIGLLRSGDYVSPVKAGTEPGEISSADTEHYETHHQLLWYVLPKQSHHAVEWRIRSLESWPTYSVYERNRIQCARISVDCRINFPTDEELENKKSLIVSGLSNLLTEATLKVLLT